MLRIIFLLLVLSFTSFSQDTTYRAAEGKIIGVWPDWIRLKDPDAVKALKETWGFSHIFVFPDSTVFTNTNMYYSKDSMMCGIIEALPYDADYENMFAYYLDEPVTVPRPENFYFEAPTWVKEQNKNSLYITGDYKRTRWLIDYVNEYADIVMFTSYKRWDKFLFWWIPGRTDQTSSWRDMKEIFADKFKMSWVSGHSDYDEFEYLFKASNKLGLDGIWLYAFIPDIEDWVLKKFCEAAVKEGFMKRVIE